MLAVKSGKNAKNLPKYWGKQIFTHRRFPEVGQKQKTERKKRGEREERLNDGDNNGQATHGARMPHAWRTHGARKPPGPMFAFLSNKVRSESIIKVIQFCLCHQRKYIIKPTKECDYILCN